MLGMFKDRMSKHLSDGNPRHIALTTRGKHAYAKKNNLSIEEAYSLSYLAIMSTIASTIKLKIPMLTFHLLSTKVKELDSFPVVIDSLTNFFNNLSEKDIISNNRIRISILGKWYDMPGRLVEAIKKIIEQTEDYASYFVNFCINYNGQEEIVDAFRLIARQVVAKKIDPESIDIKTIKENTYSSYFPPPDLIVVNYYRKTSDILLWDSPNASFYFTDRLWPDFSKDDLLAAIKFFRESLNQK